MTQNLIEDASHEYTPTKDIKSINQRRLTRREADVLKQKEEEKFQFSEDKRVNAPYKIGGLPLVPKC